MAGQNKVCHVIDYKKFPFQKSKNFYLTNFAFRNMKNGCFYHNTVIDGNMAIWSNCYDFQFGDEQPR